jgi:ketosteroid isomerase-like protein
MAATASELRDTIVAADERFMESYNGGDAGGVADCCYTGGGQLLPPNSEPVTGKPAIQAFWQGRWTWASRA